MSAYDSATPPIRYNLASSTGPVWTFGELLRLGGPELQSEMERMRVTYVPAEGSLALREQIGRLHDVDPDSVVVTMGASEALMLLMCWAGGGGGSVLLPAPGYPATEAMARAFDLTIRRYELHAARAFIHESAAILAAVDSSTRLVVVNSPHNPTGSVMPAGQLRELAKALQERSIPLVSDEVFHRLYFGPAQPSAASVPGAIVVGDMSKCLSLPGLRVGWIIDADPKRREQLIEIRDHLSISGSPLMEAFATLALKEHSRILAKLASGAHANVAALEEFINVFQARLQWIKPVGGTLAFPWLTHAADSTPLCEAWAKAGVLTVPGSTYGMPRHIRIGYALANPQDFKEGVRLMADVLSGYSVP